MTPTENFSLEDGFACFRPVGEFTLEAVTRSIDEAIACCVESGIRNLLVDLRDVTGFPPPGLVPKNDDIPDANQSTFYSSMMNVDFEIGDGNPAAVAVRFHVAQHGVLSHIDFHIGSGLAGIMEVGNVGQDLRFLGGRYGIITTNTSPFWPYTLIDSFFEGQREAAIREHQAGLTVVRTTFRDVPIGISIDPGYSDQLWLKDARFENVRTAAVLYDRARNPATQIGAQDVPVLSAPQNQQCAENSTQTKRDGALAHLLEDVSILSANSED